MYRKLIGCIELFHFELRHAKKFVAASFQNMMCEKPFRKEWFCSWIRNTKKCYLWAKDGKSSSLDKFVSKIQCASRVLSWNRTGEGKALSESSVSQFPTTNFSPMRGEHSSDRCLSRPFFALVSWSITSSSLLSVSPQEGAVNTTLHRVTYASLLSSLLTTTAASDEIYL